MKIVPGRPVRNQPVKNTVLNFNSAAKTDECAIRQGYQEARSHEPMLMENSKENIESPKIRLVHKPTKNSRTTTDHL